MNNFNISKLNELSNKNITLGSIRDKDYNDQEQIIKELIKEHNRKISSIRNDSASSYYDKESNKKILTVVAKHDIRLLTEEIREFNTYLRHLKNEVSKKQAIDNRKQQQLFDDTEIIINETQQEILANLLQNGNLNSTNISDVIKVWTYMVDQAIFIDADKEIYQIIKFINEFNLNASSETKKQYEMQLGELKGVISRTIKQYPKKTPERRKLKSYKKFVKSIIKFNKEEKKQSYDYRYDVLNYFLNDADGFIYLERLFDYDPELFNIRDQENCHIFNNILKKYIDCYKIELENHEKIIIKKEYYEELIKLFVIKNTFKLDSADQKLFETLQQDFEDYLNASNFKRASVLNALSSIRNIMVVQKNADYYQKDISEEEIVGNNGLLAQLKNLNIVKDLACNSANRKMFGDDIYTFMIENLDDAYSVAYSLEYTTNGHVLLSVHTPDLEALIPENSPLDKVLYNKMFSMNNWRRFFPNDILKDLKLNLGTVNPCITYQVELLENGNIGNSYFLKTNVKVNEELKRQDINSGLANDKLKSFIQTSYRINSETKYLDLSTRIETTYSEAINYVVGHKFEKNKLPYIYTNQLAQNSNKFVEMISNFNYIFSKMPNSDFKEIYKIICDDLSTTYYDVKNIGHNELNFKYKSDILNPLNSYLGIVAQRLVTTFFIDKFYNEKYRMNTLLGISQIKDYANDVKGYVKHKTN